VSELKKPTQPPGLMKVNLMQVYSALEYTCAILIAAGISLFAKQSSSKVTAKLAAPNAPLGYGLCAANLLFDGYTNAEQVPPCACPLLPAASLNAGRTCAVVHAMSEMTGNGFSKKLATVLLAGKGKQVRDEN
jgi:hypothetical protein